MLKRERDMLSARTTMAEAALAKQQGAMEALQRTADEARLSSKRESDKCVYIYVYVFTSLRPFWPSH